MRDARVIGVAGERRLDTRDPGVALVSSGSCGKGLSNGAESRGGTSAESVDLWPVHTDRIARLGGEPPNTPRVPGGESFDEPDGDSTRIWLTFVGDLLPCDFDEDAVLIEYARLAQLVSWT